MTKVSIEECTFCDKPHKGLEVFNLEFPIKDKSGEAWTMYTTCPSTKQRILMRECE